MLFFFLKIQQKLASIVEMKNYFHGNQHYATDAAK